jgi:nucleoside-diphosphate-sugar epimerase
MEMFLEQPEMVQEQMAVLGDDYTLEVVSAVAKALGAPGAVQDATGGDDMSRAVQAATELAAAIQAGAGPRPAPVRASGPGPEWTKPTMGGVAQRQAQADDTRQLDKDRTRRLLGREPDTVKAEGTTDEPVATGPTDQA